MPTMTQEQTPDRRERVISGFAMLTLAPSPRLREHRQRLSRRSYVTEAWREVGLSMYKSVALMGASIGYKRTS